MMSFMDRFKVSAGEPLSPGTHTYDGTGDLKGHRFHLRVDPNRKGVLIVDASRMIFLNGSAIDHARCVLKGMDEHSTIRYLKNRYRKLDVEKAREDNLRIRATLRALADGEMDMIDHSVSESPAIGADDLPSPYRMDLALTYRCQNECGHCYNEEGRGTEEMTKDQWLDVIDGLWEVGIPHIVFTGGEPTLVPHLLHLIRRSEFHGQITGLVTNGRRLAEPGYLLALIETGLDHVQVTVLSHRESVHDGLVCSEGAWKETVEGIKKALALDVYLSTNTTIMSENLDDVEDTVRFLIDLGVQNISLNGIIRSGKGKDARSVTYEELDGLLQRVVAIAEEADVNLVWFTPTPYCELNPLSYGLGIKQCTACSLNMAMEPDGSVLPCQSYYEPLGNFRKDPWNSIWDHALCKGIRERDYMAEKCAECDLAQVCGGGCPLSLEHGDYTCLDRMSNM
ncbi:MAG: radical SAM protein [Thermoplasmata archaeon]|nr:MAG: radical SAM protein [Thermoplasmata archaeon]